MAKLILVLSLALLVVAARAPDPWLYPLLAAFGLLFGFSLAVTLS